MQRILGLLFHYQSRQNRKRKQNEKFLSKWFLVFILLCIQGGVDQIGKKVTSFLTPGEAQEEGFHVLCCQGKPESSLVQSPFVV